jgi:4-hydroxy-3-methylbut-2-en-1-yl diphosphate synthase IspG/GcpE
MVDELHSQQLLGGAKTCTMGHLLCHQLSLQVKRCADAGADIVRITVQGKKEAEACMRIREQLFKDNYDTPLVADIHFQPGVALMVADAFEKIRINPGNFADGRKTFEVCGAQVHR